MKKLSMLLGVFSLVLLMTGTCFSSAYYGPVVMVEADLSSPGDGETNVTFTYTLFSTDTTWNAGEMIDGSFVAFSNNIITKEAGSVIDFAIKNLTEEKYLSSHSYEVQFNSPNSGNGYYVEKPTWVTEWYDDFNIVWGTGTSLTIEVVSSDGDPDGFAAIPIPGTLWIFGSGLIGLVGIRRKLSS